MGPQKAIEAGRAGASRERLIRIEGYAAVRVNVHLGTKAGAPDITANPLDGRMRVIESDGRRTVRAPVMIGGHRALAGS